MRKLNVPEQFKSLLKVQGIDINKYEYIGKDCESYKVKNIQTGKFGYIRY